MQGTFVYDVFGNAVEDDEWTSGSGSSATRMAFDEQGMAWADLTSGNGLQTRYLYQPGQVAPVTGVPSGAVNWLLVDHLGSVRNVTNGSGTLLSTVVYDGFGNTVSDTSPTSTGKFTYTGLVDLRNAGELQAKHRVYNPATGTWEEQDPSGFGAGDANLYRYVGNAPTNATDPSGLQQQQTSDLRAWEGKGYGAFGRGEWDYIERALEQFKAPDRNLGTLSLINKGAPRKGLFGAFAWPITWKLSKPSQSGGYIIQTIEVRYDIQYKYNGVLKKEVSNFKRETGKRIAVTSNLEERLKGLRAKNGVYHGVHGIAWWEAWKIPPNSDVTKSESALSKEDVGLFEHSRVEVAGTTADDWFFSPPATPKGELVAKSQFPAQWSSEGSVAIVGVATFYAMGEKAEKKVWRGPYGFEYPYMTGFASFGFRPSPNDQTGSGGLPSISWRQSLEGQSPIYSHLAFTPHTIPVKHGILVKWDGRTTTINTIVSNKPSMDSSGAYKYWWPWPES